MDIKEHCHLRHECKHIDANVDQNHTLTIIYTGYIYVLSLSISSQIWMPG